MSYSLHACLETNAAARSRDYTFFWIYILRKSHNINKLYKFLISHSLIKYYEFQRILWFLKDILPMRKRMVKSNKEDLIPKYLWKNNLVHRHLNCFIVWLIWVKVMVLIIYSPDVSHSHCCIHELKLVIVCMMDRIYINGFTISKKVFPVSCDHIDMRSLWPETIKWKVRAHTSFFLLACHRIHVMIF